MRELKRNRRVNESAYSSALNEVRYDVEHDFKPLEGKGGIYVGLDDVHYDFDELSATVFVLDKNDKVIDEETVSIPVDSMKDYTTREIRDMTDLMLEKINEVAENLRDSYNAYYSTKESKHLSRSRIVKENAEWDRDEVYSIIMNNENFYKEAMQLAQKEPKSAMRGLFKLAKEVAMDQVPKIRLSDKGALLVAARILEDSSN